MVFGFVLGSRWEALGGGGEPPRGYIIYILLNFL
jgi:hypothetical protein